MKILHLINTLATGGAELHLLTLCRHLRARGVDLLVAGLRDPDPHNRSLAPAFRADGTRVVHLRGDGRYNLAFPLAALRLVRRERPDVLHTHLPRADLAGVLIRQAMPAVPWMCSVHNIYTPQSWSGAGTLPVFNMVWPRADQIIAISHAVKAWLVEQRRVPAHKIRVIHYGIDADRFRHPPDDLRTRWDLSGRAVIGSIGRLVPHKGHDVLIAAMPAILREVPNACLLIAGAPVDEYGQVLQAQVARLGLQEAVRFVGFQPDVPSLLAAIDVLALATRSEGFGQVVIEAMAAGRPVVATHIPPLTEVVADGDTGLLVPLDDVPQFARAIVRILRNPTAAAQMGVQGQARVASAFTSTRMVDATLAVYGELLSARSGRIAGHAASP